MSTALPSPLKTGALALAAIACACLLAAAPASPTGYAVRTGGERLDVRTTFRDFNKQVRSLSFSISAADVDASMDEFGFSPRDIDARVQACLARQCTQAELDAALVEYYENRGLEARQAGGQLRLSVAVPRIVSRNRARVRPVALALEELARSNRFGPEDTFGAALAFVQTALEYRKPPSREQGRNILSFHPPPRALAAGSGDCDTKSALLAAVMTSFSGVRMIGVHIPGHYLVGIARIPRAGDAFIEYRGEKFVLVEPSGPAWLPPGMIADSTQTALNTMQGVRIDPLF